MKPYERKITELPEHLEIFSKNYPSAFTETETNELTHIFNDLKLTTFSELKQILSRYKVDVENQKSHIEKQQSEIEKQKVKLEKISNSSRESKHTDGKQAVAATEHKHFGLQDIEMYQAKIKQQESKLVEYEQKRGQQGSDESHIRRLNKTIKAQNVDFYDIKYELTRSNKEKQKLEKELETFKKTGERKKIKFDEEVNSLKRKIDADGEKITEMQKKYKTMSEKYENVQWQINESNVGKITIEENNDRTVKIALPHKRSKELSPEEFLRQNEVRESKRKRLEDWTKKKCQNVVKNSPVGKPDTNNNVEFEWGNEMHLPDADRSEMEVLHTKRSEKNDTKENHELVRTIINN